MERRQYVNTTPKGTETLAWLLPRGALAVALSITFILEVGFNEPLVSAGWFLAVKFAILLALWGAHATAYAVRKDRMDWMRQRGIELVILLAASASLLMSRGASEALGALLILYILSETYVALAQLVIRYSLLFVGSFALLIVLGTLLLMLPRATPEGNPISTLDALFTSTSAVCVTGLIVRDTATEFTEFGQIIILILIQLGGLGIIIFGALLATMLSGSISVRHASNLQEAVSAVESGPGNVDRLVRFVVVATLCTEALGAGLLYLGWSPFAPADPLVGEHLAFHSIFVSISAFCNAGFSIYSDNLESFRYHWTSHVVIAPLIVCGGLGFPVLYNMWHALVAQVKLRLGRTTIRKTNRDRLTRLNLHTKVVLVTTAVVFLLGTLGLFAGQLVPYLQHAMATTPSVDTTALPPLNGGELGRRLLDATFMSTTARTAGFNTMNMEELTTMSRFVLMMLMWIGGSPGGTAGGVKTTVVAVLLLTILATLRNRDETEVFNRSLPETLVRRAGALVMLGFVLVAVTTLLLTISESFRFSFHLFEAVSATSTVGLTLGLTSELTSFGRFVIIVAMFLGRVGPLAMLGAVAFAGADQARYRYPSEAVMLG